MDSSNDRDTLMANGETGLAFAVSKRIVEQSPSANDWFYHGVIAERAGDKVEAANAMRRARDLRPDEPLTYYYLSKLLMRQGHYREAMASAEHRFDFPRPESPTPYGVHPNIFTIMPQTRRLYDRPLWDGKTDLAGRRIVVFHEYGFGDCIQDLRYLPKLKEAGAHVILEVKPELLRLCQGLADEVVLSTRTTNLRELAKCFAGKPAKVKNLPNHDLVVSLHSLAYHFDPDLKEFGVSGPYLNVPKGAPLNAPGLKVGICWAGSEKDNHDRFRSCPAKYFQALAQEGVSLISLQKGPMKRTWHDPKNPSYKVDLMEGVEPFFVDLGPSLSDFLDTAQLMRELDLVVSVDTSVVHLAGAVGTPTWVLLSAENFEWRWDLSVYPNVRTWWQPAVDDWGELLNRVRDGLSGLRPGGLR